MLLCIYEKRCFLVHFDAASPHFFRWNLGPPRGYREQRNLPFLLMGTWENEQGNLGTMWILGGKLEFILREQSKNIFENKGDY